MNVPLHVYRIIQTIYSQWKEIWIFYNHHFILLILYFQRNTSKSISQLSYSQYWIKGHLDTSQNLWSRFGVSQKLGSRFGLPSTQIIQVTYSQHWTQNLGSRFGVTSEKIGNKFGVNNYINTYIFYEVPNFGYVLQRPGHSRKKIS